MSTDVNPSQRRVSTFSVYLIFTASGAAALVYQVIWARWLGLVFGNTTTSISIVLASFMMGLALGSYIVGRLLHRIKNPMIIYAYLELGIGIYAVCFPLLTDAIDVSYSLLINADSPIYWSLTIRSLSAFLLLLVPTTFMGATLPLLTDFFRRSPRHTKSWKVGLLYAANTIGAAIGTIIASFILIELIGIWLTTLCAAGLNFLVAALGAKFSYSTKLLTTSPLKDTRHTQLSMMGKSALVVLAASGAIALGSEILWTRALEILIGNSTYAFATILVVYLVGIAVGSWLMSLVIPKLQSLGVWLSAVQLGMGLWIIAAITLYTNLGEHLAKNREVLLSVPDILNYYLLAACLLLPLAILSGATFPLATRIIQPNHEDAEGILIARAYAWNTLGALLGSLVAGFIIAVFFDFFQSLYLLASFYGIIGLGITIILFWLKPEIYNRVIQSTLVILALGITGYGVMQATERDRFANRIQDMSNKLAEVSFHKPGLQGVTSVIKMRGRDLGELLLVNGTGMTVKVSDTKLMSHLPMFIHPDPADTLVICFGMGTSYRSALSHGGNVTVVELVGEVLEAFDQFHYDASKIRSDSNGKMVVNDGRNFLKLTDNKYDVITIDPPPPIDARGVTNLYSKEFIELAKSHLKKDGIMAHWIPLPNTGSGVNDWSTFYMLVNTFKSVFKYTAVRPSLKSIGWHVLGSMEPITIRKDLIAKRVSNERVRRDVLEWDQVPISFFTSLKPIPQLSDDIRTLTDDRPYLEFNMIDHWKANTKKQYPFVYW